MGARGQVFDLGHAVHRVVVRLARYRPVDALLVAESADRGDPPGAIVGEAEIANLALSHEVAERAQGFGERRLMILAVEVVDVDVVGAEPAQAVVDGLHHALARQPVVMGCVAGGCAHLGRQHPALALGRDGLAGDLLRAPLGIAIGGVDEVDAAIAGGGDNPFRARPIGRAAEHHRAETEWRDLDPARPELAVLHGYFLSF